MMQFTIAGRSLTLDRTFMACAAAFIAPTVVLLAAADIKSAAGPMLTMAQTPGATAPDPTALVAMAPRPTAQQLKAAAHARELESGVRGDSPLYYPTEPIAMPEPVIIDEPTPQPVVERPIVSGPAQPSFTVTSIFRAADGREMAIVSGKLRNVGDSLADGWTLTAINLAQRTITVSHDRAEPVTMPLARP